MEATRAAFIQKITNHSPWEIAEISATMKDLKDASVLIPTTSWRNSSTGT